MEKEMLELDLRDLNANKAQWEKDLKDISYLLLYLHLASGESSPVSNEEIKRLAYSLRLLADIIREEKVKVVIE